MYFNTLAAWEEHGLLIRRSPRNLLPKSRQEEKRFLSRRIGVQVVRNSKAWDI